MVTARTEPVSQEDGAKRVGGAPTRTSVRLITDFVPFPPGDGTSRSSFTTRRSRSVATQYVVVGEFSADGSSSNRQIAQAWPAKTSSLSR